jgi:hypothetical protein
LFSFREVRRIYGANPRSQPTVNIPLFYSSFLRIGLGEISKR